MIRFRRKIAFSTKPALDSDYKSFLSKYKESLNQILSSANASTSLGRISVKLANSKKDALLNELGTINLIDSQKAEITTFDPQLTKFVMSSLQSAGLNLTMTTLTPSKLLIQIPKQTSSNKSLLTNELKKRADQFKNEMREIRRKEINDFRASTKDKDAIKNFELQNQKKYELMISEIDKELDSIMRKVSN